MITRNKNRKQAYHELLRSDDATLDVGALPEVMRDQRREYRRSTPFLKRLGNTAARGIEMTYIVGTNPHVLVPKLREKIGLNAFGRVELGGPGGGAPFEKELDKQRQKAGEKARKRFRKSHPNIAQVEAENFKKAQKSEIESRVRSRTGWITEYFRPGKQSSLSKAVPARRSAQNPNGLESKDYDELARTSLEDALRHRHENGSIPLLGRDIAEERMKEKERALTPYTEIHQTEDTYVDGIATALWKLGFLEFENEGKIDYADGKFNPDITWTNKNC